jgi:hypothetical protein
MAVYKGTYIICTQKEETTCSPVFHFLPSRPSRERESRAGTFLLKLNIDCFCHLSQVTTGLVNHLWFLSFWRTATAINYAISRMEEICAPNDGYGVYGDD